MTLRKITLEKENNNYLLAQIGFIENKEIIRKESGTSKVSGKRYHMMSVNTVKFVFS